MLRASLILKTSLVLLLSAGSYKRVNASTWARPAIGSRANCVACHPGAEQGNFNEHSVRIPG